MEKALKGAFGMKVNRKQSAVITCLLFSVLLAPRLCSQSNIEYQNPYYPLKVGNYWVYERIMERGTTITEEKVTREFYKEGYQCFVTHYADTLYMGNSKVGDIYAEGDIWSCIKDGNVYEVCRTMIGDRKSIKSMNCSISRIDLSDPRNYTFQMPKKPLQKKQWFKYPYDEYGVYDENTEFLKALGSEDIYIEGLNITFRNCIKVKIIRPQTPLLNNYSWYCPYIGKVKDQQIETPDVDTIFGTLIKYSVKAALKNIEKR